MGKIVMPKNSALLNEIESVLQIYYETDNWLPNDEYKAKLKSMIGELLKRIKLLSARIDSLTDENKTLNNKLDSTKNELVQYKNDNKLLKIRLNDVKEQNSVLQTKVNDHNHSMLTMSKKLNKSEARNIALTRFVKETTRNQIHLKNGQSITVYDAIINRLSSEDKTMVRKTMDLEGNKNSRNR